jgi:hypothetical protein
VVCNDEVGRIYNHHSFTRLKARVDGVDWILRFKMTAVLRLFVSLADTGVREVAALAGAEWKCCCIRRYSIRERTFFLIVY